MTLSHVGVRRYARIYITSLVLLAPLVGCQRPPASDATQVAFRTAVSAGEWLLHEIDGKPAPFGAGGRVATLRFDADSARISGFAGCNRYFGSYTIVDESLRFSRIGMTEMACDDGMTLEQQLAAALEATRRYELSGRRLTLLGETGPVARFERSP